MGGLESSILWVARFTLSTQGIDTGDILLVRTVDVAGARNVSELRKLGGPEPDRIAGRRVLQYVMVTGKLPPRRSQTEAEGLQYFTMHPAILDTLNERLSCKERGLRAV